MSRTENIAYLTDEISRLTRELALARAECAALSALTRPETLNTEED